jgi:putative heme-binding domain-containing protein
MTGNAWCADDETKSAPFAFQPGDHVCLIGNTLAERMQHDGELEAYLHTRFPEHDLVFRNLGFSGDELTVRLRSESFGSPDEWLARCKADVVFAFFGYNESFAGKEGLDKFRKDLDAFIRHTLAQKYNGKSAPRLVLFSPIAQEKARGRDLPDGSENNKRLALYTEVMAEVANANQVRFVDLFHPTLRLYAQWYRPVTINGIHLSEHGNLVVARMIDLLLFDPQGDRALAGGLLHLERWPAEKIPQRDRIREAVRDKNFYWFNRYRTVDGYSIYGGRADLKFVDGQTNREVMQREMEVLDVMTANRDRRVWSAARGQEAKIDDSNTPPFIPVKTNKPGPLPGGKHRFLGGEEAIRHMTVAKGMKVNLFADENMFPELVNPVQMAWDARGRLWVAVWPTYPHWKPKEEMNDKILILEDTDGDGKADKCTVFADRLHCPTGFEFYGGGVLVAQAPDLLFLQDTDGDGKADVRRRVLHGLDSADTHHTSNSFALDPGGAVYFQEGTFHHTQVETPYGPPVRCANAGVYRYEPRTQKFEAYITHPFANPHGHVFDRWGQDIVVDGTGSQPYHAALFSGHLEFPQKHATPPQVYQQRTRPCPGIEILSSRHFPEAMQGNLLVPNVIGFQGILRYRVDDQGASFTGTEAEPMLSSSDPNFRPSDLKVGPDGAVYFLDWHNPIIGHMQHNLRDPSRDREHGRIYRVTCEGRPLLKPVPIAGEPLDRLFDRLREPEDRVRYRARVELGGRASEEVVAAAKKWAAGLDPKDPDLEHHLLEALWVYQAHDTVDTDLLTRVLGSPDFRARAAAARVFCYWRDRVPDALERFKKLADDEHPRVRLEAVRAASFFKEPEALEVALVSMDRPSDPYVDFTRAETLKALDPHVRKVLTKGQPIHFTTTAARHFLETVHTPDLLRMKRDRTVCAELLVRKGVRDEDRRAAAATLAGNEGRTEAEVLVRAIGKESEARSPKSEVGAQRAGEESVLFDLARLLTERPVNELAGVRDELKKMATVAESPLRRELGFVALVAADGGVEPAWTLALRSPAALQDLVKALPFFRDPGHRAALFPKVEPLLNGLPEALGGGPAAPELRAGVMNALTSVRGQEGWTFKVLARLVGNDADRPDAIRALQRIPAAQWPAGEVKPLLETLLERVRRVPAKERTKPEVLEMVQLADALAASLPPTEAKAARREIGALGVRVMRVATVPDQMLFDPERLVVQAGKPVEIRFENTDLMPHNLVVVRPGGLEEVGTRAEATATDPGALERNYVPPSDQILFASRLLAPRSTQRLQFSAPTQPGVYPYVCTYPGHWRRMYGALYVVADLEDYLADPDGYVSRNGLAAADPLLKFIRPRTEWKFEELAPAVRELSGRSFTTGRQMFQVASCVACHKLGGAGVEFGPDLAKLDPKQGEPVEVLRDILEPSVRINEKYQTYVFALESGKVITGLVLEETPDVVKVIENPLVKAEPVVLRKAEIAERTKSPTSVMPKGLLDKLTREEILDLIAYVIAAGDSKHALFQGGHGHGH